MSLIHNVENMKSSLKQFCPPLIWDLLLSLKKSAQKGDSSKSFNTSSFPYTDKQDLDLYWNPEYTKILEEWGKDHVWNEIQMLLNSCKGRVLDIACGSGVTVDIVAQNKNLEVHGCDISDFLIDKAINRGIEKKLLKVCDATNMACYETNFFEYSYSIGSLEHFTDSGILEFVAETDRITTQCSYHMVPISKNGQDNGWIKTKQSYFNNSEEWWIKKFKSKYKHVISIKSGWKDEFSIGMWFICKKD